MKMNEIRVGGLYRAKVSGVIATVRVDRIDDTRTTGPYHITNLRTGRRTTFRTAAKFLVEVRDKVCPQCKQHVPVGENYDFGMHRMCYARSNAAKMFPPID